MLGIIPIVGFAFDPVGFANLLLGSGALGLTATSLYFLGRLILALLHGTRQEQKSATDRLVKHAYDLRASGRGSEGKKLIEAGLIANEKLKDRNGGNQNSRPRGLGINDISGRSYMSTLSVLDLRRDFMIES